jgi:predicted Zn-dependent protease
VDFYHELVEYHPEVLYHSLSLGRALHSSRRGTEAIPHFQRYLRTHMDAAIFEELAEVYEQAGQSYMATSARQIAASIRSGGS